VKLLEEPPHSLSLPEPSEGTPASDVLPQLVRTFRLFADETRLRIVWLLVEAEEYHVRALCELIGQSQPAVSHHLALLRDAGLIECRREGKHNYYRLTPSRLEELLDLVFADKPVPDRRIRVGKYALACAD
jgi:ArsR family transcriptional regulator, arsenate/arsenite/antimonite-responsive transcriptional repressor